ncbi:MAG: cation transporter [Desulfuromonadaceae bacterium]|nr:cation transporter [Desulfuromonadaceae bacterium]
MTPPLRTLSGKTLPPPLYAARTAILVSAVLAGVKTATGLKMGSLALLSSAADSFLDLVISFCNFFALRQSQKPADTDHPYGHGKFETLATLLQSLLVAASGVFILNEAAQRLRHQPPLQHLDLGLLVLAGSSLAAWQLSRHLRRVGQRHASSALQADALHYATDVYSNLALLAGLFFIRVFEWYWIDAALSLFVGGYILWAAFDLLKGCINEILEVRLPDVQQKIITDAIEQSREKITGYHNLRTRRSGTKKMIDFHLTVCRFKTIQEAHDIAEHIEQRILKKMPKADITIHLEPTDCQDCGKCFTCTLICDKHHNQTVTPPAYASIKTPQQF